MITVAIRPERLSYEYIKETKEFVVNLPAKSLVKEVDYCGVRSGKVVDKNGKIHFEKANLMCYSHGEYFPIPEKSIGKFGFSVQKKKTKRK